jgi:hypothetical protein
LPSGEAWVQPLPEPNRALDEFDFTVVVRTTDPLITRKRLKLVDGKPLLETQSEAEPDKLFRTGLNRDHQVVWDSDPVIAQAETIAHGRILMMKQVWRADGYSLGDLLYSLPLAPLQKKNIAIVDWSRSDSFRRDESQTNVDSLSNYFGRERDISEIANSANRLVGIIGNSLVMPVAPGIRLDYLDDVQTKDAASSPGSDELLEAYRPLIPNPAVRISVPTKGVFAESVMGRCNACEKIDNSRNWKYWEHPLPDEPTAIEPISAASRAQPVQNPTTTPMTSPIINQVHTTMQSAPDPSGLGKMLEVLGNPNTFRDMAGLAGTQQGAREALASSFDTTTKFGDLAAQAMMKMNDMVAKAVMTYFTGGLGAASFLDAAPGMKESIGKDAKTGRITTGQAQESISRLNNALTDAFTSSGNRTLFDHPEISNAVKAAARKGASLSASHGDSKVDIGESGQSDDEPDEESDRARPWPLNWLLPNAEARTRTNKKSKTPAYTQVATITFGEDGRGTLKFGNREVPCRGMRGIDYPKEHVVNAIVGKQWQTPEADKYRKWVSTQYGRRIDMPWSIRLMDKRKIFIHEFPDVESHGCIHLAPGDAKDFYDWVDAPTLIRISYPWNPVAPQPRVLP